MAQTAAVAETRKGAPNRLTINRLGLWLFFGSETFLFGAIISSRYYLQGVQRPEEVNQALGLAITGILLLSSLTAFRAEAASARGDHTGFLRNMFATIALGILFIGGVGIEWFEGFEYFPPSTGYGSVFFATTGIHAAHVLSGVIMLGLVLYLGRRPGRFTPQDHWGVEGSVKYWHFVDVAWVFIYPTLYLVK
jgi:cytochrome c oxidase subunit 3